MPTQNLHGSGDPNSRLHAYIASFSPLCWPLGLPCVTRRWAYALCVHFFIRSWSAQDGLPLAPLPAGHLGKSPLVGGRTHGSTELYTYRPTAEFKYKLGTVKVEQQACLGYTSTVPATAEDERGGLQFRGLPRQLDDSL